MADEGQSAPPPRNRRVVRPHNRNPIGVMFVTVNRRDRGRGHPLVKSQFELTLTAPPNLLRERVCSSLNLSTADVKELKEFEAANHRDNQSRSYSYEIKAAVAPMSGDRLVTEKVALNFLGWTLVLISMPACRFRSTLAFFFLHTPTCQSRWTPT